MHEKHSSYWFAQQKTAESIESSDTPLPRGKKRKLLREAVQLGDEREKMGLTREAPTHLTMIETLRKLHPSRRKRHGKRK